VCPVLRTAAALLAALCCATAGGASFERAEVTYQAGRYQLRFLVDLAAATPAVRALLTDYDHLDRLSAHIIESRRLAAGEDQARVRIVLEACVFVFCKTVRRVMAVETRANGDILTLADPAESDFRHAREIWQVSPQGRGTRLTYEAEFEPSFFIPPLIGPWLVKSRLREALEEIAARLEDLAVAP
jgi:hypothetical protein